MIMSQEWTQSTTVHAGGKVEVILPSLVAGERVEVTVRKQPAHPNEALRKLAGTLSDEDAREMRELVDSEFEQINSNDWK